MNDITSLIREVQSMVTMLWLVTARIIDDGKLPRLKAERWGKPYRLRWFLKEWSFQMNWFFIDYKILRSEKIGHAHDKSKCLHDNSCDGSTFDTHIKSKNKKQRLRFQKLDLRSWLLVYVKEESNLLCCYVILSNF